MYKYSEGDLVNTTCCKASLSATPGHAAGLSECEGGGVSAGLALYDSVSTGHYREKHESCNFVINMIGSLPIRSCGREYS